jgi:hypothetical protein
MIGKMDFLVLVGATVFGASIATSAAAKEDVGDRRERGDLSCSAALMASIRCTAPRSLATRRPRPNMASSDRATGHGVWRPTVVADVLGGDC